MTFSTGKDNPKYKHGFKGTRLYNIWKGIKKRCHNPNSSIFKNYGGRGIDVCQEWGEFVPFKEWALANGYKDNLSLDRINTNGNYEPDNCRWADSRTQNNNRINNRCFVIDGKKLTLAQIARLYNISYSTLNSRINRLNWSIEKAINQ